MTEQTNTESAPNVGAGSPNPVSPASGQSSSAEATGAVTLQELANQLEELKRANQSAKDREFARIRQEFEAKLAEVSGKPVAEVKTEAAVAKTDTGTVSGAQAIPEAIARFTEVGFPVSDPDVSALIQKSGDYKDRRDFLLEVERTINRKSIKPPVSAGAVIPSASAPPSPPDVDELTREYTNKVIANRGNKNAILALKAEYKKRGVPVDKVGFTIN